MSPLPKNDNPIDITQIAQALGVSKTTVSRAISGNGRIRAAPRRRLPCASGELRRAATSVAFSTGDPGTAPLGSVSGKSHWM